VIAWLWHIIFFIKAMLTKPISFKKDIVRLLSVELGQKGSVCCQFDQVIVTISREDFEQNFGKILLQVHRTIEEYYPERTEHVFIFIRDPSGFHKNMIKVWKTL
jgi:hypothetical protein